MTQILTSSDADGSPHFLDDDGPQLNVTTLLVVRRGDGLSRIIDALTESTRRPDRLVVIDTTRERTVHRTLDEHPTTRAAFPSLSVVTVPAGSTFADTIDIAVEALPEPGEDVVVAKRSRTRADKRPIRPRDRHEWFWLLHEDNVPQADALESLIETVGMSARIGVAGCKVRELGRRRRLVNVGLDVTRTGRHVGDQVQGEFDQGQYDDRRDVLAVSSSGLLIRRDVYATLGGFDPAFDGDGDGLDLCWRAHLTGHQVVVVPEAVIHQDVTVRPDRRHPDPDLPAPRSVRTLRRHRQVALARSSLLGFPAMGLWIFVSGLVMGLVMLMVKRPQRALAEFAQATAPFGLPRIVGARSRFFGRATARRRYLRPLFIGTSAALASARESLHRAVTLEELPAEKGLVDEGAGETGPVDDDAQALAPPRRPLGQLFRSPGVWAVIAALAVALVQWRHLLGSVSFQGRAGTVRGGELRPFGVNSSGIWQLYRDQWTGAGLGGPNQVAEYLPVLWPFAWLIEHIPGLQSETSGHTAVLWLLVLAMPLSALAAYRAGRVLTPHAWPRAVVALLWATSATLTTATAQGRLGPAVAHVLLPLVFGGIVSVSRPRGSTTMTFATTAAAGLLGVFAPLLLAVGSLAALLVVVFGSRWARLRALVVAVAPWILLGGFTRQLIADPRMLFSGPGSLVTGPTANVDGWQLALLHPGGPGSFPVLLGLPLVVLAVLGLMTAGRHRFMLAAALIGLVGLAGALVSDQVEVAHSADLVRTPWSGAPLDLFALCCAGIALAGLAVPHPRTRGARAALHPAVGVLAAALTAVVAAFAGWSAAVTALRPVSEPVPEIVRSQYTGPRSVRALVLTVGRDGGVGYRVEGREAGRPVSDLRMPPPSGGALTVTVVRELLRGQDETAAGMLHRLAIGYVVVLGGPDGQRQELLSTLQGGGSLLKMNSAAGADVWRVAPKLLPGHDQSVASSRLVLSEADGRVRELPSTGWHGSTSVQLAPADGPRTLVVAEPAGWARAAQVRFDGRPLTAQEQDGLVRYSLPPSKGRLSIQLEPVYERTRLAQGSAWLLVLFVAMPFGNRASRRKSW